MNFAPLNLVGYAQSALDTDYGAVMTSAQFVDVASTDGSISLNAIKPAAGVGVDTAYLVEIQILDNAGYTTEDSYLWNGATWEAASGDDVSKVTFAPGQGLWVMSSIGEAAGLQSSGKVGTSDVDFDLDEDYGAAAIGNPFPTAVALNDILPIVDAGVDASYLIEIQILDNAGYTTENSYLWNGSSWEAASGADVSTITFAPGQGLWVMSSIGAPAALRFPAPEL